MKSKRKIAAKAAFIPPRFFLYMRGMEFQIKLWYVFLFLKVSRGYRPKVARIGEKVLDIASCFPGIDPTLRDISWNILSPFMRTPLTWIAVNQFFMYSYFSLSLSLSFSLFMCRATHKSGRNKRRGETAWYLCRRRQQQHQTAQVHAVDNWWWW